MTVLIRVVREDSNEKTLQQMMRGKESRYLGELRCRHGRPSATPSPHPYPDMAGFGSSRVNRRRSNS